MFHAHYRDLANAFENRGIEQGVLRGTYSLIVRRKPKVPKHSSTAGKGLLRSALSYIAHTSQNDSAPKLELWRDATGFIQIAKSSANNRHVALLWVGAAKREYEIIDELAVLIRQSVNEKLHKLARRNVPTERTFLVLYDADGYAEPRHAASALQRVEHHTAFHSVFWAASFRNRENATYPAAPGRYGMFIYSAVPSWQANVLQKSPSGT